MNSIQLESILRNNKFTKRNFLGVFAADNLPKNVKRFPHCFIANTDPQWQRGEHWVALWIPNSKNAEYFCSLGEEPNASFQSYLSQFKNVLKNNKQIQGTTENTCGHYCIYFLVSRASGHSFAQILDTLWRTRAMADMLVKFFVRHLMMS